MTQNKKVWFITGAGRGMGVEFAKAALANGDKVVATGRDTQKVESVLGKNQNLLIVKLDVTNETEATTAVKLAVEKFGSIDVVINNAGNFYTGFFEELTSEQIKKQMDTNLYGPMNVTRAALPFMRKARSGHIVSISSVGGLLGGPGSSAYSASKFALEGWMECLRGEVAPFGIKTTLVEPGFFRTELLAPASSFDAELSIDEYEVPNSQFKGFLESKNQNQEGDPAKLASALVSLVNLEEPPFRFLAGKDAIGAVGHKVAELQEQINAHKTLSCSLDFTDAPLEK